MIAKTQISISLKGASFVIKAGAKVPAPVLKFWQSTNQISRLTAQGAIYDETAETSAQGLKKTAKKPASDNAAEPRED